MGCFDFGGQRRCKAVRAPLQGDACAAACSGGGSVLQIDSRSARITRAVRKSVVSTMSSIDALWSELKEEEHRMRRTPKASAGIPSFSTHLIAPPDSATIATAGIAGMLHEHAPFVLPMILTLRTALAFGGKKSPAVHNKSGNDSDDEDDDEGECDRITLHAAPTTRPPVLVSSALSLQSSEPVTLEREARSLASPNVLECCGVLSRITALLEDNHSSSDAVDTVLSALIRPLIAALVHPVERCRDFAARTIILALDRVSDAGDVLPLCLPTLLKRLVATKSDMPCESSEEVRLLLLLILSKFMTLASSTSVAPYLTTIVTIITAVASDNHPEIRKEACHCVALMRRPSGGKLKPHSKQIFDAILPSLMHRLARVRLAAVTALGTLLLCGGAELILACIAWQEPNVIPIKDFFHDDNRAPRRNYFGMLAADTSPLVRHKHPTLYFCNILSMYVMAFCKCLPTAAPT